MAGATVALWLCRFLSLVASFLQGFEPLLGFSAGFACMFTVLLLRGRGEGEGGGIVSSISHAASRVRLNLAQLQHSMTLSWLVLTLSAVIILRLSGALLPAELQGFSTFPVEDLESFFVVPLSDPSLYFAVAQLFGLESRVLKFSLAIKFRSCPKGMRAPQHP